MRLLSAALRQPSPRDPTAVQQVLDPQASPHTSPWAAEGLPQHSRFTRPLFVYLCISL